MVLAEDKVDSSSKVDQLDVVELADDNGETKSSEAQRKRDSGYSYTRPDRFSSPQRWEPSGVRGRIITKPSGSQTVRPFNRYGPPKQTGPHSGRPSSQYAPQHQYSAPHNRRPQHTGGQTHQEVPSPVRTYDFVEPSPIASQNNEPFNSNAAGYLPPRNQKLPGYTNSQTFSIQQTTQIPVNHQQHQQQQHDNFGNNFQSQQLVQGQFRDQQQISDAALFLAENAQAISQLYETPATNVNYEPVQNFQGSQDQLQNPNSQFQTFDVSGSSQTGQIRGIDELRGFQGRLPSYASGILDPQQTLQQIQSLEKDRIISQLQRDLVTAQGKVEASTSARYAQNHQTGSYAQNQAILASLGTQINPSIGPQLDRPNSINGQRPFGHDAPAFGGAHFLPTTTTSTGFLYGLQSTTPATQSPSTTTAVSSSPPSTTPQRPVQGASSDGSSQVGTSVSAPGTAPTYPYLQYGGFVPTIIGTNLLTGYPNYGTNYLGSGSSTMTLAQPAGSSPTHFGIPIPSLPSGGQEASSSAGPPLSQKPQPSPGQHHQQPSTPVGLVPLRPIQPIHPIAAAPVHPIYPIAPTVTQVHPVQPPVPAQPTYGVQPAVVNPILIKPVKAVYPVYYYPNVYQIQKPALPTYPWNYAPSYAQAKPGQIWK